MKQQDIGSEVGGKVCTKCNEWKPLERFGRDKRYKNGWRASCYDCKNSRRRENFAAKSEEEKEVERAKQRQWRIDNHEAVLERDRKRHFERSYGITEERYYEILEAQGNRCAICGTDEPGHYGRFYVDHDHDTDAVRGLLCNDCNRGLGNFKDSLFCLESAIAYLIAKNDWRIL